MDLQQSQNFHVYKSSAGSGKTYTLVKEYLKLVLSNPAALKNILAITFTNAAAAEMKERIIGALGQIVALGGNEANPKTEELVKQIIEELAKSGNEHPDRERIISRAEKVLNSILHEYGDFAVSTIDSFVHRVIRTFAFDLHIPLNFEVELDNEAFLRRAVDLLLRDIGRDVVLTQLLIDFMVRQTDENAGKNVDHIIVNMAKALLDEKSHLYIKQLESMNLQDFRDLAKSLRQSIKGFEETVAKEAQNALNAIKGKGLQADMFFQKNSGVFGYFNNLDKGKIPHAPNSHVTNTVENNKWTSQKATPEEIEVIEEIKPLLINAFENIQILIQNGLQQHLREKAVLKNIYPLGVLNQVGKILSEIRNEEGLLHISDFNRRISAVVEEQPVPFIYERLGEKYRHYMIDEFQDTSLLQWQNLLPLVDNALASGGMGLVVGDGKQAIYRFRNGDVEQFAMLPNISPEIRGASKKDWEQSLHNNYKPRVLEFNFRSAKAIVEFNNRFFDFAKGFLAPDLQSIYQECHQKVLPSKGPGYVSIWRQEKSNKKDRDASTLGKVLETIQRCTDAGHPLSDITVLCRDNNTGQMVAMELLNNNIPVVSQNSLLLSHSGEVRFFLAILRLLHSPHDTVSALEIIHYLIRSKRLGSIPDLHDSLESSGLFNPGKTKYNKSAADLLESFLNNRGVAFSLKSFDHHNPYETCERILARFFAGEVPPNAFVAFFMDAVYEYSRSKKSGEENFLQWWENNQSNHSLIVPKGMDAVQVMTIHKSKGLQFPVVIHPFAGQTKLNNTLDGFWASQPLENHPGLPVAWLKLSKEHITGTGFESLLEKEIEKSSLDLLNGCYVALTRASEKLFIISEEKRLKALCVQNLLEDFLSNKGQWNPDNPAYEFGQFDPPAKPSDPSPEQPAIFQTITSKDWRKILRMRSHQAERSIALGRTDPLERGNLLHRIMENINTPEDVQQALVLAESKGELDQVTKTEWQEKITGMLKIPEVAPWFSSHVKVKKEAGLFDSTGAFFRPDRVAIHNNCIAVIDYKTGRPSASHDEQVRNYGRILKEMGYASITMMLLYLDQGKAKIV